MLWQSVSVFMCSLKVVIDSFIKPWRVGMWISSFKYYCNFELLATIFSWLCYSLNLPRIYWYPFWIVIKLLIPLDEVHNLFPKLKHLLVALVIQQNVHYYNMTESSLSPDLFIWPLPGTDITRNYVHHIWLISDTNRY